MLDKSKKFIAICLLVAFSFLLISPVYADVQTSNVIESGQYVDDGVLYEYSITESVTGEMLVVSYSYDGNNNKKLEESFTLYNDGENIYIDSKLVATTGSCQKDISPYTVIDSRYNSGKYVELIEQGLTKLQIATTLASGLIKGTWASITVGLLMGAAEKVIDGLLDTVFFEQYVVLETFPEDRPGITVRETNEVRYYSDKDYNNAISDWISNVYEAI